MNFIEWMEATNPKAKGTSIAACRELSLLRTRVAVQCGTKVKYLVFGKCAGYISKKMEKKLIEATASDSIRVTDLIERK